MENTNQTFFVTDTVSFKNKMLNWTRRFNIFCFLDNNNYHSDNNSFDCLLAVESVKSILPNKITLFEELKKFSNEHNGWLFGHLNYPSLSTEEIDFPLAYFFIPEHIIRLHNQNVEIQSQTTSAEKIFNEINELPDSILCQTKTTVQIENRITHNTYIETIEKLKCHIKRGDCYEINFCQDFFSQNADIDPLFIYHQLNTISPNPFSAYYKMQDKYCLCASPERFLLKSGNTIISQPIKGTIKRELNNEEKDQAARQNLLNSNKDRSENVMIVDLVRNDLSKISNEGSVHVRELYGIYAYPQVYQMISTIEGKVDESVHWTEIIEACYPMGSMTGAPKKRVMELIEQYEVSPRGLFSGSIGYVEPNGDFDFNVVIRSLFYNATKKYLSFNAGGGITFYSDPQKEYEESLIKVKAIKEILKCND